jgi:hypothetical protein
MGEEGKSLTKQRRGTVILVASRLKNKTISVADLAIIYVTLEKENVVKSTSGGG